jgi:hypothetical protein|tara:strand:+ start:235 stop:651 length:417 start_codon:yes stop_codon:yes gene_type:complete
MKIFLSPNEPLDKNLTWINNIGILDKRVLDSEATNITCENFLCNFDELQMQKVLEIIFKKIRMKGRLFIKDFDLYSASKAVYKNNLGIEYVNSLMSGSVRSFLSIEKIEQCLPQGYRVTQKQIKENDLSFVICIERVL